MLRKVEDLLVSLAYNTSSKQDRVMHCDKIHEDERHIVAQRERERERERDRERF